MNQFFHCVVPRKLSWPWVKNRGYSQSLKYLKYILETGESKFYCCSKVRKSLILNFKFHLKNKQEEVILMLFFLSHGVMEYVSERLRAHVIVKKKNYANSIVISWRFFHHNWLIWLSFGIQKEMKWLLMIV